MSFAKSWDDLKDKMNQGDTMELNRSMRKEGKDGIVFSGFKLPTGFGKIIIRTIRFGNRPMDHPKYNYNSDENTILVIGDYSTISFIYKKA